MNLEQLQEALLVQQRQSAEDMIRYQNAMDERSRHESVNQSVQGVGIPIRRLFNRFTKDKREGGYNSALETALDSAGRGSGLEQEIVQLQAMMQEMEANATRAETEGLYRQTGMSQPEAALRSRDMDIPAGQKPTSQMQNYQYGQTLPPGQREQFNKHQGGQSINVYTGDKEYMMDTRPGAAEGAVVPRPGGGEEYKRTRDTQADAAAVAKGVESEQIQKYDSQIVVDTIDRVLENIGPLTTGWGSLLKGVPESDALSMAGDLDTIMANLAFDRLQQMRNASITGGALGQVSERELKLLQSTKASLEQKQSPEDLRKRLIIVRDSYQRFIDAINNKVPDGYVTKTLDDVQFIKIGDEWYPL